MLAQEALNASDASLWAIVSNGVKLRILRDNPSLTRPAHVEVDLEALFTEELLRRLHGLLAACRTPAALARLRRRRVTALGSAGALPARKPASRARGKLRYQVSPRRCARWAPAFFAPGQRRPARRTAGRSGYDRQACLLRGAAEPGLPVHLPGHRGRPHRHATGRPGLRARRDRGPPRHATWRATR